ncbi:glycosyltransferase family 2 protein [Brackiella oedipodis]|uniref:glycosyltransferase family 2 protein n=1 Tax=Brackiella oedipodis TaxID=124225 RepID=UPI000688FAE3|nr:glycosyltransferase [Brackiella oedipodis]
MTQSLKQKLRAFAQKAFHRLSNTQQAKLVRFANRMGMGSALGIQKKSYQFVAATAPQDLATIVQSWPKRPVFSIIVPVYNPPLDVFKAMVASVQAQWYRDWQLILVNDCSPDPQIQALLQELAQSQTQILALNLPENQGISGASNAGLKAAQGDYIVLLDHDDSLTADCLFELARCIHEQGEPEFIYSDEDKQTAKQTFIEPHFKPDWSPDTLMSYMYTGHVCCVQRALAQQIGFRSAFNGAQDWDFVLRVTEQAQKIVHLPKVLYHWNQIPSSTSSSLEAKPYVLEAAQAVRLSALERRQLQAQIEPLPGFKGYFSVNYLLTTPQRLTVIVVADEAQQTPQCIAPCVTSVLANARSELPIDVIVVSSAQYLQSHPELQTDKAEHASVRWLVLAETTPTFSQLRQAAALQAQGDLIGFIAPQVQLPQEDALVRMAGYASLPHSGVVGIKLVQADTDLMVSAGILSLKDGLHHAFASMHKNAYGYMLRNLIECNYLAVSAACFMLKKTLLQQNQGLTCTWPALDAAAHQQDTELSSIDLGFKLYEQGYFNSMIQTREALMAIAPKSSRVFDPAQSDLEQALLAAHPSFKGFDPFFSPNLQPTQASFEIA